MLLQSQAENPLTTILSFGAPYSAGETPPVIVEGHRRGRIPASPREIRLLTLATLGARDATTLKRKLGPPIQGTEKAGRAIGGRESGQA